MPVGNGQSSFPAAGLLCSISGILLLLHFYKIIDISLGPGYGFKGWRVYLQYAVMGA